VRFFPNSGKEASTEMTGEGTQVPSLPQTPSLWRINQMSFEENVCSKLYNGQIVSSEGFTQRTTASVATGNCLNGGVHPTKDHHISTEFDKAFARSATAIT
jgi:hypothetical protein